METERIPSFDGSHVSTWNSIRRTPILLPPSPPRVIRDTRSFSTEALALAKKSPKPKMDTHVKTPEICLAAVQSRGEELEHVPEELKTYEFCLAAVQHDSYTFDYVPESLKTPELYLIAASKRRNDRGA